MGKRAQLVESKLNIIFAVPNNEIIETILSNMAAKGLIESFASGFPELDFEGPLEGRKGFIVSNAGSPYVADLVAAFHRKYWINCSFSELIFSEQEQIIRYI